MTSRWLFLFLVACGSSPAQPKPALPELSYDGKPVSAACVAELFLGESDRIDVRNCADRLPDSYQDYQALLTRGATTVIQYELSGGGTGHFTGLAVVAVVGHELLLREHIAGGDRCNGGLVTARAAGDELRFSVYVTPHDIVELSERGRNLKLEAYSDLEASASSCFGEAQYRYRAGQRRLTGVTLGPDSPEDRPGWTSLYTRQACFNGLVRDELAAGRKQFERANLDVFIAKFVARCS